MAVFRTVFDVRDVRRPSGGRVQVSRLHERWSTARQGHRKASSTAKATTEEETSEA